MDEDDFQLPPGYHKPPPFSKPRLVHDCGNLLGGGETTLALIKSHIVEAGCAGEVLNWIVVRGVPILTMVRTQLERSQIDALYQDHMGQPYYPSLCRSVSGPIIAMVLHGSDIIARWRALLGATNSMIAAEGTLRARYGSRVTVADNVAHGSDSERAARRELACLFPQHVQLWTAA